eukprot:scaffold8941_cov145-Skeletonema_menzelii.AAC.10
MAVVVKAVIVLRLLLLLLMLLLPAVAARLLVLSPFFRTEDTIMALLEYKYPWQGYNQFINYYVHLTLLGDRMRLAVGEEAQLAVSILLLHSVSKSKLPREEQPRFVRVGSF